MSLLRVQFAVAQLLHVIMLLECLELFFQDRCRFHRGEDRRDATVDLKR
ncbi:hypothetical protein [Agrobacterium deltaense]|nr:hypothetical protein [Agrobacterium deltaense]